MTNCTVGVMLVPVSYTHLDVYKRQAETVRNKNTRSAQSRSEMFSNRHELFAFHVRVCGITLM